MKGANRHSVRLISKKETHKDILRIVSARLVHEDVLGGVEVRICLKKMSMNGSNDLILLQAFSALAAPLASVHL